MVLIAVAPRAGASSFSLFPEQSVTGLGVAGAGGAAAAYDASTIFYNPAGMSFLQDKVTLTVGASYIVPDITFSNHGSLTAPGSPIQAPTRGQSVTDSDNADFLQSTVPQFYVTYKYNDRLAFGLGVNSPFGVETNYNSNSVVRYNATDSRITLVNINPSISYKILPNLSLGAGINIAYTDAALHNAIDFGLINAQLAQGIVSGILTNPGIPAALRPAAAAAAGQATAVTVGGVTPQNRDGFVRVGGDDTTVGWNIGLLYEPTKSTKLGLSFRSNLDNSLTGHATFQNVPDYAGVGAAVTTSLTPILGPTGAGAIGTSAGTAANGVGARFVNKRPISADLDLPMSLSASFVQDINPAWAVMGDVSWTRWSSIEQVQIVYQDAPSLSPAALVFNYNDTFRYSLGTTYTIGRAILRLGAAYDNTPVDSKVTRTPRLPDNDRITLGAGASFNINQNFSVDLAYNHVFFQDADISNPDNAGHLLVGKFETHADIFSLGATYRFGGPKPPPPSAPAIYTK